MLLTMECVPQGTWQSKPGPCLRQGDGVGILNKSLYRHAHTSNYNCAMVHFLRHIPLCVPFNIITTALDIGLNNLLF